MESFKRFEVSNLLSPPVLVSPTTPVSKVVGILKDVNAYEAFLEERGKIGLVTIRDILKTSNITTTRVGSLALSAPKLSRRSTVGEAARLMMEYRIRALPVVEDTRLVGEITALSIIDAIRNNAFSKIYAKNIMTSHPVTISSDDLTSKARSLMIRRKIDHLPVLTGNKLSGVLTSSHIVFNMFQATETIERSTIISEEKRRLEFSLGSIMDSQPLICQSDDYISFILDEMIKQKATYSIVALWGEIQGIITYRDYMKLVADELTVDPIPVYIVGLPEDPFEAEMVKSKFISIIQLLKKTFPFIEEAKSIIKTPEGRKERQRYEVSVSIITPKRTFSYSGKGWDLPKIFDEISNKLKKMMTQKRQRRVVASRRRE